MYKASDGRCYSHKETPGEYGGRHGGGDASGTGLVIGLYLLLKLFGLSFMLLDIGVVCILCSIVWKYLVAIDNEWYRLLAMLAAAYGIICLVIG